MRTFIRPALSIFIVMTIVTGLIYPFVITGIAQAAFPQLAGGSLIVKDGTAIGSTLIGQHFSDAHYFWGRPSATSPQPYNGTASGGSNWGPLNPALIDAVKGRIDTLRAADPDNKELIPVDLVTASASGLDPHISVAAARYQVPRIARARGLDAQTVQQLVVEHTEGRLSGFLGEPRINVLELNLALDRLTTTRHLSPP